MAKTQASYWSGWNTVGIICSIILSGIGTVIISLDVKSNLVRIAGVMCMSLITGINTAMVSFHIPDNIDKLIDIASKMSINLSEYDKQIEILKEGKDSFNIEREYKTNKNFRKKAINTMADFSKKQNMLKIEMLKVIGSSAKLHNVNQTENNESDNFAKNNSQKK